MKPFCEQHPQAKHIAVAVTLNERLVGQRVRCAECYKALCWACQDDQDAFNQWLRTGRHPMVDNNG